MSSFLACAMFPQGAPSKSRVISGEYCLEHHLLYFDAAPQSAHHTDLSHWNASRKELLMVLRIVSL